MFKYNINYRSKDT